MKKKREEEIKEKNKKQEKKIKNETRRKKVVKEEYKYKAICDDCSNKKCLEYDTLSGAKFTFGKGELSPDMLNQYNEYCKTKITKLQCVDMKELKEPLV